MRAQLQAVLLALAALKRHTVVEALEVQHHGVALLGRTVDGLDAAVALGHAVDLGFHFLVGDVHVRLGHFQTLVVAQGDLGVEVGLHGEDDTAVFAVVQLGDVGRSHSLDGLLHDGLLIEIGIDLVDSIFIEHLGAVHALHDLPGRLALAEARDKNVLASLVIGLGQSGVKLRLFHFNNNRCLTGSLLGAFHIHWCRSSYVVGSNALGYKIAITSWQSIILTELYEFFHSFFRKFGKIFMVPGRPAENSQNQRPPGGNPYRHRALPWPACGCRRGDGRSSKG